jgi:hypothetical protein
MLPTSLGFIIPWRWKKQIPVTPSYLLPYYTYGVKCQKTIILLTAATSHIQHEYYYCSLPRSLYRFWDSSCLLWKGYQGSWHRSESFGLMCLILWIGEALPKRLLYVFMTCLAGIFYPRQFAAFFRVNVKRYFCLKLGFESMKSKYIEIFCWLHSQMIRTVCTPVLAGM